MLAGAQITQAGFADRHIYQHGILCSILTGGGWGFRTYRFCLAAGTGNENECDKNEDVSYQLENLFSPLNNTFLRNLFL